MKRILSPLLLLVIAACSKTPEPTPTDAPKSAATTSSAMPAPVANAPADVAWTAPKAWVSAPNPSPMRKATFKIPKVGDDPEDGELTVSSAGGGIDPNIKRWAQQFGSAQPKIDPVRDVNGLKVTTVEIKGTYAGGGPMMGGAPSGPKTNYVLLGAIVDMGERQEFFKLVGPEKTITAAKKDFDAFVSSFRAK